MREAAPPEPERYWRAAAVITLLLFVDGFDLFLLGKIAPAIAAGFGQRADAMEFVFTAHQIGLAIGAFLVPFLADRFGARRTLVLCALVFGGGNILSAWAPDMTTFAMLRGFCGIFMSGVMAVGLALLSEKVPPARLGTVLAVAMVGMSAGAAANGIAAAWLLDRYGWQSGLIVGGVLPLIAIPLLLAFVPESRRFLHGVAERARPALSRQLTGLFADGRAAATSLLWLACFLNLGHTALVAAWLPTFFQQLGGVPIQQFALVSMLSVIGGSIGTLAVGWLQDRLGPILVTAAMHVGNGLGLLLLGWLAFGTAAFSLAFIAWSFFQSASIAGINLLLMRTYPVDIRATGAGWASGMGRIGGMLAPAAGAMILTTGLGLTGALAWTAVPMMLIGLVIIPSLALLHMSEAARAVA